MKKKYARDNVDAPPRSFAPSELRFDFSFMNEAHFANTPTPAPTQTYVSGSFSQTANKSLGGSSLFVPIVNATSAPPRVSAPPSGGVRAHAGLGLREDPKYKRCLVVIDPQVDFVEGGALPVKGSTHDCRQIARMLYDTPDSFTAIFVSLDWHNRTHIANNINWQFLDPALQDVPMPPFTKITYQMSTGFYVSEGKHQSKLVKCRLNDLKAVAEYFQQRTHKHEPLTLWPPHCIAGSVGATIQPDLQRALDFWSSKTGKAPTLWLKGDNDYTESFSAIVPDMADSTQIQNAKTKVNTLNQYKEIVVGGEALDYCVQHTIRDMIKYGVDGGKILLSHSSPIDSKFSKGALISELGMGGKYAKSYLASSQHEKAKYILITSQGRTKQNVAVLKSKPDVYTLMFSVRVNTGDDMTYQTLHFYHTDRRNVSNLLVFDVHNRPLVDWLVEQRLSFTSNDSKAFWEKAKSIVY